MRFQGVASCPPPRGKRRRGRACAEDALGKVAAGKSLDASSAERIYPQTERRAAMREEEPPFFGYRRQDKKGTEGRIGDPIPCPVMHGGRGRKSRKRPCVRRQPDRGCRRGSRRRLQVPAPRIRPDRGRSDHVPQTDAVIVFARAIGEHGLEGRAVCMDIRHHQRSHSTYTVAYTGRGGKRKSMARKITLSLPAALSERFSDVWKLLSETTAFLSRTPDFPTTRGNSVRGAPSSIPGGPTWIWRIVSAASSWSCARASAFRAMTSPWPRTSSASKVSATTPASGRLQTARAFFCGGGGALARRRGQSHRAGRIYGIALGRFARDTDQGSALPLVQTAGRSPHPFRLRHRNQRGFRTAWWPSARRTACICWVNSKGSNKESTKGEPFVLFSVPQRPGNLDRGAIRPSWLSARRR